MRQAEQINEKIILEANSKEINLLIKSVQSNG
jgi:hypothetical protein